MRTRIADPPPNVWRVSDIAVLLLGTGSLREDLQFLRATYEGAAQPEIAPVLRAMASEGLRNEPFAEALRAFTAERRAVLQALIERDGTRSRDAGVLTDLAYGLLWCRIIVGHAPLDCRTADAVAKALAHSTAGM